MKILLDMGHCLNGSDTGAQGNGYKEQGCTREIGYKVKSKLEALGHTVIVCSRDSANSVNESLAFRVNKANTNGGDLYLSIHLNAGRGNGVEVYTYGGKHFAEADSVLNSIVALGYQSRGIKDGSGLYVIRNTHMKAMLVECCFIDSSDMQKYNAENFATAIVKGLTGQVVKVANTVAPKVLVQPVNSYNVKYLQHEVHVTEDNIPGPITLSHCPLVGFGAQGNITRWIQSTIGITADGIFGNQTRQSVINFQKAHGLQADGIVGQNTWRALLGL